MYPSHPCGGYVGVCGMYVARYIYIYKNIIYIYIYMVYIYICVCVYECILARMYAGRYVSR